jgi:hypothetical protein
VKSSGSPLLERPHVFTLQCGRIIGFTESGIVVCTFPMGHSGECVRASRLCRELVEHPCRKGARLMFVNFPDPYIGAVRLAPGGEAVLTVRELIVELEHLQCHTIIAVADCMDAAANQFERLGKSIGPEELRHEAQKLREWKRA